MPLTDAEIHEIYQRCAPAILRRCRAILRDEDEARDAVQEVFARVLRHGDRFRGEASPMTFMYRISTNYCLNQLRNRATRANRLEVHKEELGDGLAAPVTADLDLERVLALLDEVDEETRACVIHTYFDDCTRQETAELVGISVPTVRKRVGAFLDLARRQLGIAVGVIVLLAGSLR
jgi:RNA polymerase sigma-70 factor (ECF subfamily)